MVPIFIFFKNRFAAQSSTNLAQLSTTFVFSKKQNGGAVIFKHFFIDFEEPENQRVFLDHKVPKKMFFFYSRVYIVMQG